MPDISLPYDAARDRVTVQALIVGNHVEASPNGLLYISGGGVLSINRMLPDGGVLPLTHLGIAAILSVPWTQTNRTLTVNVMVQDEDASTKLLEVKAQINVGRPPTLRPGTVQYPSLGIPLDVVFPKEGTYQVMFEVEGESAAAQWMFTVNDIRQPNIRTA